MKYPTMKLCTSRLIVSTLDRSEAAMQRHSAFSLARCLMVLILGAYQSAYGQITENNSSVAPTTEKTITLDPFDVRAGEIRRYMASNSISGTAMNMPLKDVPMTINVITSEFMEDANITDIPRALDFNSSVTQTNRPEIQNQSGLFAIRGFRNRNFLLDGVLSGEFLPSFLVDRIEIVKGPNTLYGQSDPGGLINVISKRPLAVSGGSANVRWDSWNTKELTLDVNRANMVKGVNVRLLGSMAETDGWRWLDGTQTKFGAAMVDWQNNSGTKVRFLYSANLKEGQPANRGSFPMIQIPTDLNHDGDTLDIVGGVTESTARYYANFVPWEYTSATRNNFIYQRAKFGQLSLSQKISNAIDMIYTRTQADQITRSAYREFDTFIYPTGIAPAAYRTNRYSNNSGADSLSVSMRLDTGPITHAILAGARHTRDYFRRDTYLLRANNNAEKKYLDSLGRSFRYQLVPADITNHAQIWLDDSPTWDETIAGKFRATGLGDVYQEVSTFFLSDSASFFDGKFRTLAGIRRIEIIDWSFDFANVGGAKRHSRDTSYQIGANYALTPNLIIYSNNATSFNPNGIDSSTGQYFEPERSNAWEVGFKIDRLLGDRVSGSVAYYEINKDNVVRSDFNGQTFVNDIEISSDRSKGLDLELYLDVTKNWQSTISYSNNSAKTVKSRTTALGLQLEGAIPEKWSLFTSYTFKTGALSGLRIGGGGIYVRGPIQQLGTSVNRLLLEDGYTELSFFARYSAKLFDHSTTFGFNVSNLTNERYMRAWSNQADPRKVSFSVRTEF